MNKLHLPVEVEAVFQEFYTCELSTYSKNGCPTTWPTLPSYLAARGQFIILTSVGLPQKVYNIRRNPRVSILFSNPTGSGLARPPAVLVQGDARVADQIYTRLDQFEPEIRALMGALGARMIQRQALRVEPPPILELRPGPACLLFHSHDEQLAELKSFEVRGRLELDGPGWILRPEQFIPGMGILGLRSYLNFVFGSRRTARKYLQRLGLPWPKIPWDELMDVLGL
jgi:hypothetical protein